MPEENRPKPWTMTKNELRRAAEEELNETTKTRRKALREFREWIRNQDGSRFSCLKNTTDEFLLRFLRMKKTNVPKAAAALDKYISFRSTNPEWFEKLDIRENQLNDLISSGYIFVLPGRDANGRRVVFSKAAALDGSRFTSADIMRAHLITYEALLLEEECQINGLSYLFDEEGVNFSHVSMWTPSEAAKAFGCAEGAIPLRHKEMNFVSMPWTMTLIFQFAKSLLSFKLRSRLHTQSNFEKVKEFFPENNLPREYGGEIPMQDMIESWKDVLLKRREKILALDSIRYHSGDVPTCKLKFKSSKSIDDSMEKLKVKAAV